MYTLIPNIESAPVEVLYNICILHYGDNVSPMVGSVYMLPEGYHVFMHGIDVVVPTMEEVHRLVDLCNVISKITEVNILW